ncbi:hypothetical protein SI65_05492 [Aspergillus cristatus]|uniref:Uncharacterized protein n=1 Tax=Aspergillus cristatus TaxID=573508 RepID=A0A1E3BD27_ASPCR|nr:hypothetical protein SI65_05492 [Aspergillus cristatus]
MDWNREAHLFADVVSAARRIIYLARFPPEEESEWVEFLEKGTFCVFIAVLVSQLHNVKTLRLDYSFIWFGGYPGRMVMHSLFSGRPDPASTLSRFESLWLVDYGGNMPPTEGDTLPIHEPGEITDESGGRTDEAEGPTDEQEGELPADRAEGGNMPTDEQGEDWPIDEALVLDEPAVNGFPISYNLDQFVGWFCLSSVRHFSIWLPGNANLESLKDKKLNLPQLQTLILARSTASAQAIASLLIQTQSLKSLHLGLAYDWYTQTVLEGGGFITRALQSISETIEDFSMGLEYYPRFNGSPHEDESKEHLLVPFHGILRKFPRLQTAEIPMLVLLGLNSDFNGPGEMRDLLPRTLRRLVLRGDLASVQEHEHWGERISNAVRIHLEGDWRASTPLLQHVCGRIWFWYWYHEPDDWWLVGELLKDVCGKAGIRQEFIPDNLGSGLWSRELGMR